MFGVLLCLPIYSWQLAHSAEIFWAIQQSEESHISDNQASARTRAEIPQNYCVKPVFRVSILPSSISILLTKLLYIYL